jgi:heme-degrading monooxygenase HmoA
MIARVWKGWASTASDADTYEEHFRSSVMRELSRVDGFLGCRLLRRDDGPDGEIELVAVTFFASLDAVRGFAGDDYETAVVEPEARRVLARFEERSVHYRVAAES